MKKLQYNMYFSKKKINIFLRNENFESVAREIAIYPFLRRGNNEISRNDRVQQGQLLKMRNNNNFK